MKQYLFLLFFLNCCFLIKAQETTPKKIGVVAGNNFKDTVKNADIRERLVQLATNNPNYEISDRQTYVALYQLHLAKSNWLAAISAQANVNQFTMNNILGIANSSTNVALYYPIYNFGVSIPFDYFTRNSNAVKIARENFYIAQAAKNQQFRLIKADVLTKYEDYLLVRQKLELQSQVTADAYTNYQIAERDYRLNVIKAEEYSKSYKSWVTEQLLKLDYQRNLNVSKIELEKVIGVKLEDVFREN